MKLWKRILALALSFLMAFCVLPMAGITEKLVQTAKAAEYNDGFTAVEFGKCYANVLLSQVGKGYRSDGNQYTSGGLTYNSGYTVGGRRYTADGSHVTSGTPYSPLTINSPSFDCYGFVITCLMAMGYSHFSDGTNTWYLNAMTGGQMFEGTKSIFYKHKTGDEVVLYHSNDSKYNIRFRIGEITNKASVSGEVKPGTIMLSITDSSHGSNVTTGAFSAGNSIFNYVNHASVALFALDKDTAGGDTITKENQGNYTDAQRNAILSNSYNRALSVLQSQFGVTWGGDSNPGNQRATASHDAGTNGSTGAQWVPYLWDARGRGRHAASTANYKTGFRDNHATFQFNTPYSRIWQVESLNENVGVSVNNNPYGKYGVPIEVYLEPIYDYGSVSISKVDSGTGAKLSGAKFDLYEWSVTQNKYVISSGWEVKDPDNNGVYDTYVKGTNTQGDILLNGENQGKIKVVETQAPSGYEGGWSKEHEFTDADATSESGGSKKHSWTVDASNDAKVGLYVHKLNHENVALSGAVFTLYSNEACTAGTSDLNSNSTFTTNSSGNSGNIVFKLGASAQTFYLKETTVPTGYVYDNAIYRITVAANSTGTITIAKKVGSGSWVDQKTITAANAKAMNTALDATNPGATVGFMVHKTGNGSANLSGAVFTLYNNVACTSSYVVTDYNGHSTFTSSANGNTGVLAFRLGTSEQTYYLKETTAPTGYQLNGTIFRIRVQKASDGRIIIERQNGSNWPTVATLTLAQALAQNQTIDVDNPGTPVGLHIHKTGVSSQALSGAVFTLYNNVDCASSHIVKDINNNSTFTSGTNGDTGNLVFRLGADQQIYYVKETTVPSGYKSEGEIYRITVAAAGTGTITIAKSTNNGSTWTNVKTITAANAKNLTSSDSFDVNNPPLGTLRLQKGALTVLSGKSGSVSETAVGGYTFSTTTVNVGTVGANSQLYGKTVTYEVKVKGGSVLSGQTYKEYNSAGTQVGTDKTVPSNGRVTFNCGNYIIIEGLNYGTYTVTEISAPDGWTLNATSEDVTIDADHKNPQKQINDTKATITVTIKKTTENGTTPLTGGLFGLYCTTPLYAYDGTVLVEADSLIYTAAAGTGGVVGFPASLINVLPGGKTYYVKELKAPDGYYPATGKAAEFTYQSSPIERTIKDTPVTVTFKKLMSQSGSGFTASTNGLTSTFTIYKTDGSTYKTVTTSASGTDISFASFTGTLYMLETTAPTGYVKSTNLYEIVVGANGSTTIAKYTKGGSGLTFQGVGYTKTSSVQTITASSHAYNLYDTPLGDLEFTKSYDNLLSAASKGSFVNSGDSAAVGKYTTTVITESLFDGYDKPNSIFYQKSAVFELKAAETIKDENGNTIYAAGAVISGVSYANIDKNGTAVYTGTTNANGRLTLRAGTKARIYNLPLGKYTLTEISAPDAGYGVAAAKTVAVVNVGNVSSESFADNKHTMDVSIVKRNDNTETVISGGLFGIYCTTDIYKYDGSSVLIPANTVFQIVTAGSDGKASFDSTLLKGLPVGKTYKVCEIKAPDGFIRSTAEHDFVYVIDSSKSFTFDNTELVDITFSKSLTALLSGKSGSWDGTSVGNYTYDVVQKDVFTVNENSPFKGQTVTFRVTAGEAIKDADGVTLYASGAKIANAPVQIINAAGTVTNATTDANGEIIFPVGSKVVLKNLPYGTYKATEIAAPPAYLLNGTAVSANPTNPAAVITDTKRTFTATIVKKDEQKDAPISGGLFGLYCTTDIYDYTGATLIAGKDTVLAIRTAAADGTMEFGDIVSLLPYGKEYYIKEIEAPEGFRKSDKKVTFTYTADGATGVYEGTIPNLPLGSVTVVKTGAVPQYTFTDKLLTKVTYGTEVLAGAKYEVYVGDADITFEGVVTTFVNPDGDIITLKKNTLVATLTTGADGTVTLSDLPCGNYVVKEKAAPSKIYKVSVTPHTAAVANAKDAVSVTENDPLVPLNVKVLKKDSQTDEPVKDAIIGLFTTEKLWGEASTNERHQVTVDGVPYELLMVRTTDADGLADFSNVKVPYSETDKLVVMEIEAPIGYLRDDGVYPVKDVTTLKNEVANASQTIHDKPVNIMGTRATSTTDDTILQQGVVSKDATVTVMDNVYFAQHPTTSSWRMFIAGYNEEQSGRELTVVGKLVDTKTGEFLKDKNGDDVKAEVKVETDTVEIITEGSDSYFRVKVQFTNLDTSELAGKTIVMYEYVYLDGVLVSEDTNIANAAEMLYFPKVGTTFVNKGALAGKTGLTGSQVVFEDTVKLENILVGQKYRIKAKVYDKDTGKFFEVDGKEVLATADFTATKESDTRAIIITLDTLGVEDHSLVCFEYLYTVADDDSETLVYAEDNPNNVQQTQTVTGKELPSTGRNDRQVVQQVGLLLLLFGLLLALIGCVPKKRNEEV